MTDRITRRMTLAAGAALIAAPAGAQDFPTRPITLVIPFSPAGGSDLTARALVKAAEPILGQPITVVNRPAGGGAQAMQEVARAAPDGYTLVNSTAILTAIAPNMRDVPYNSATDFTPIMTYGAFNTFIAVRADSQYQTLQELLDFAKANPRVVTVGVSVIGASSHLGMARLAQDRGAQVSFVPFGGGAPAVTALLGRHITSVVVSGEVLPHVASGQVRLLATLMGERVPSLPNVPSIRELGFDWSMNSWLGIAGPANMPQPVVKRLQDAFLQASNDANFKRVMDEIAVAELRNDAAGAARIMAEDIRSFEALIKELKLGRYAAR
ncbi:tripartite tricarboxylate transporter substrate binding protein [Falsiroseomonas sp.]|uniref:tripartite tricarboxylate transporter substrate binding protein n=1 Tax=Falsiroseomonas sp. TaxID=2870721 RepID=UPI00356751D7